MADESVASGFGADERTVTSYFGAFAPAPAWHELVWWPPDVFALTNLILDHTGSYRFAVAPPRGRRWPPFADWAEQVKAAAEAWRDASSGLHGELPPLVRSCWDTVTCDRDLPLERLRSGEASELAAALLALHAMADEACSDVASFGRRVSGSSFECRAWTLLQAQGSLSRLSPARVRIVPKTNFSGRGITIRSLSRYLALSYESVEIRWRTTEPVPAADPTDYNIVLLPWPLSVEARDFHPAPAGYLENMDSDRYGFFEFAPGHSFDAELVDALLAAAVDLSGRVDAVVLPEAAVYPEALDKLEVSLAHHGANFLIAGVREAPEAYELGRNYLHFGVRTRAGWNRYEQDKNHRWCLDEGQIRQYHLTRALDPRKLWWEAIDVRERALHVIDVGSGITTAPLVCEDLARLDEVADVVRRVGPSLVVAVLLDGPQLSSRWPCRYSRVLTDDPGSAVLTLTSFGMAARSRPPGKPLSRVVAHWNSAGDGLHEIALAPKASGILMSTSVERSTVFTADGRLHSDVPRLKLAGLHQLRVRTRTRALAAQ